MPQAVRCRVGYVVAGSRILSIYRHLYGLLFLRDEAGASTAPHAFRTLSP